MRGVSGGENYVSGVVLVSRFARGEAFGSISTAVSMALDVAILDYKYRR